MERSCKPAATPQGFHTSIQPQLDHPDLRCSNNIHRTTNQTHSTHNSVDLGEHHHFLSPQSCPADSRILIEATSPIYRAHSRYLANTGHTITRFGESQGLRDFAFLNSGHEKSIHSRCSPERQCQLPLQPPAKD